MHTYHHTPTPINLHRALALAAGAALPSLEAYVYLSHVRNSNLVLRTFGLGYPVPRASCFPSVTLVAARLPPVSLIGSLRPMASQFTLAGLLYFSRHSRHIDVSKLIKESLNLSMLCKQEHAVWIV